MEQSMGLTEESKQRKKDDGKEFKLKQEDFNYDNAAGRMQILAVVAHELGHWANSDFIKNIVITLIWLYSTFFAFSYAINKPLAGPFGFEARLPTKYTGTTGKDGKPLIEYSKDGKMSVYI
jgi:hypothetical protein